MLNKVAGVVAYGALVGLCGVIPAHATDDEATAKEDLTVTVGKLTAVSENEASVAVSFTCPKDSEADYTIKVTVLDTGKDKDGKKKDLGKLVYAEGTGSGACEDGKGTADVKAGIPKTSGGQFTEGESYKVRAELTQDLAMSKTETKALEKAPEEKE